MVTEASGMDDTTRGCVKGEWRRGSRTELWRAGLGGKGRGRVQEVVRVRGVGGMVGAQGSQEERTGQLCLPLSWRADEV